MTAVVESRGLRAPSIDEFPQPAGEAGVLQWVSLSAARKQTGSAGGKKEPNRVNYKQKRIKKYICSKHDIKIIFTLQCGLLISG